MSEFIAFKDNTKRKYIINTNIINAISHMDGNDYIKIFYNDREEPASYYFESARVAEHYFDSILTQLNE